MTDNILELKENLISGAKLLGISEEKATEIFSDDFLNGLIKIRSEQGPSFSTHFMDLVAQSSSNGNLLYAQELNKELQKELRRNQLIAHLFNYVNKELEDINLDEQQLQKANVKKDDYITLKLGIVFVTTAAFGWYAGLAVGTAFLVSRWINMTYDFFAHSPIKDSFISASETRSPLIIDLDGDGVETTTLDGGVHFDHDGNGFAEKTAWVGKDDGLLVRDINNNGKIDNGSELFGDNTILSNGQKATNGFEALADLDSNQDGIFNSQDAAWDQVKIWKDKNQNGQLDAGELLSLNEAGIEEINLNYQNSTLTDENGNTIGQTGSFTKGNGTTGSVNDIWFNTDLMDTVDKTNIQIPEEIKALPDVQGFGNVHSLQIAMALDTTGTLKSLVEQYITETDISARKNILYNIIYHWTGVQDMDPNGRDPTQVYGKVIDDTRKLEAIEEFMGEEYLGTWCWGERDPNPHGKAAPYILRAFDILADYVNNELLFQTHYKSLLENIKQVWNEQTEKWDADVSSAVASLQDIYNTDATKGILTFREFENVIKHTGFEGLQNIYEAFRAYGSLTGDAFDTALAKFGYTYGTEWDDNLTGTSGVDEIQGLAGNDSIYGGAGNDTLDGGDGDDNLFGEDGNDILIGGAGNDYLIGGNGADTYLFNPGFGHDAIDNSDDNASSNEPDIIQFGEGISPDKVSLGRQGYDLIITVSYDPDEDGNTLPDDSIRVYSYFDQMGTSSATVNSIVFEDGTSWDYEYVLSHWNSIPGVNGGITLDGNNQDNVLEGTPYNDILIGNGGNDTIYAGDGNDRIQGGTGNDILHGGIGDDTYLWNWGDGMDTIHDSGNHDKISFGSGISYSDLKFRQEGDNLRIIVKNNESQGMLLNAFFIGLDYKVEDLYFHDGSIVHLSEIPLTLQQLNTSETINLTGNGDTVYANGGDDTINGGQGNDTIIGGKGNDTINGGDGADTYIWNLGDDLDTIVQASSVDTIKFGPGISFDDLSFRNEGNNLRIYVNGNDSQGVICENFFLDDDHKSKQILFSDGTSFALPTSALTLTQKNTSEHIIATVYNDTIYANGGNDTVYGGNGNDTIYGGDGFDTLHGEDGNDTLIGGKGNDTLYGGYGADTYVWNLGDGWDRIEEQQYGEEGKHDKIKFGEGITFEDLTFERDGYSLNIYVNGDKTQGIQITNQFWTDDYQVEYLEFADGTTKHLTQMGLVLQQNSGNEETYATDYNDTIYGNGGNDILHGYSGDDILVGGKGNDTLYGGSGADTYVWNLGDGWDRIEDQQYGDEGRNDKIKFGEGITFDNLTFERDGYSLNIYVNGDKTQGIQITNQFWTDDYQIEYLEFADGTTKKLTEMGLVYQQSDGDDDFYGSGYDDVIYGNGGRDTLRGGNGNDTIYGGDGNDTIYGEDGDDTLVGGKGNDTLEGGYGNDTYIYNLGDGFDVIADSGNEDKVIFGEGISFDDLTFERDGSHLNIYINGDKNQGVRLYNQYYSGEYSVETLEFSDGSSVNLTEIGLTLDQHNGSEDIYGTNYNDVIYAKGGNDTVHAGNGNDIIYGGDGNDTIYGEDGNDTLVGGKGHDTLEGGYGNDTYLYNLGDGFDVIADSGSEDKVVFGEGISFDDLTFERDGNHLNIYINGDKNQGVCLYNQYYSGEYSVETLEFSDGSSVNLTEIGLTFNQNDYAEEIHGTNHDDIIYAKGGNDVIFAGDGNDILSGGTGHDRLEGGAGNDTYLWNIGDGIDTIADAEGNNKIKFGTGISADDLSFAKVGNNLRIIIDNNPEQGLIIENYYLEDRYKIDAIEFANGSTASVANLRQNLVSLPDLEINGTDDDDILTGGNGNDTINAGDGYNDITGGKGNDILNGGYDRDTYYYNQGDGYDVISDPYGRDKIIFGEGISSSDIALQKDGDDLLITFNNNDNDSIRILRHFYLDDYKIELLEFTDGSSVNLTKGLTLSGTDKSETIDGSGYDDIIYGGNGNDTINGGSGADIISGGKGNDIINGNDGIDTYIWNLGDDLDTITASDIDKLQFGERITLQNLSFRSEGDNLRILVNNDETQGIILAGFFYSNSNKLNIVKFADGRTFNLATSGLKFDQHPSAYDTIHGTIYDDVINAQNTYSVTIDASYGNDVINAGDGNDTINAGDGNDIISGGKGNDVLNGGNGDDIYLYNLGDDFDTINESNGYDKIIFGEGISFEDLSFRQYHNSLIITINNDPTQGFEITNYYYGGSNLVEELQFSDGTRKLLPQMDITLQQGNHNETIDGTNSLETIYGNGGNDVINGGYGNDIIIGGSGNDTLNGGGDDDTYIYNLGDGLDTISDDAGKNIIVFGTGITQNDLAFSQIGNNLLIYLNGDKNQGMIIENFFYDDAHKISEIHFADNSVFYLSETALTLDQSDRTDNMTINGTDFDDTLIGGIGNDTINAGDDNDILIGGKGNDTLNGGYGRDIYVYNLGDGMDTINETRGNDKIKFGNGITKDDLTFTQEGNNLRIIIKNDIYQSILINGFYENVNYQVENIEFADGSKFNLSTQGLTLQQTNANDSVSGTPYDDIIYGNGGHDTINSGDGNDTLVGGLGNDTLNGGSGNDTYIYNLGDGFDIINESGGNDKIVFGEGINLSNLSFERIDNNLKISINGDEIKGIQINDQFGEDNNKVETIEFHDGSTLDISNADQLIQAMNSFSLGNSASTDTLSNPTQDVSEMYGLAANSDINKAA